jgi:hypothetical protein
VPTQTSIRLGSPGERDGGVVEPVPRLRLPGHESSDRSGVAHDQLEAAFEHLSLHAEPIDLLANLRELLADRRLPFARDEDSVVRLQLGDLRDLLPDGEGGRCELGREGYVRLCLFLSKGIELLGVARAAPALDPPVSKALGGRGVRGLDSRELDEPGWVAGA